MKRVEVRIGLVRYNSIGEAARENGIIPATAYSRLNRGWTVEEAVTAPTQLRLGSLAALVHPERVKVYNRTHKVQIKVA